MKTTSMFLGCVLTLGLAMISIVQAQTEVVTVQGNLPRFNYRDSQGSILWSLPANSVLWKVDGPTNAGVIVLTAASKSGSITINEGGVSIRGSGFPAAKLHVGNLASATEPGEVRIDPGNPAAESIIHAVNGNITARMILESQSPSGSAIFRLVTPISSFSQTLAANYAIRDNLNAVNPVLIVPSVKNVNSIVIKNGNIGLGVVNPTNPLVLANGAQCTTGGVWTNASSRKLKDNVEALPLDKALDVVQSLEPVTYTYKAEPNEPQVGFIAEDVPELVATKSRTELSPMDIVGVLTKVVQDQQSRLDAQEQQLKQQSELLQKQQEMLERLAERLK